MKVNFLYCVIDTVAKNIVRSFFAASDAEAARMIKYSLDKEQIPKVMANDLILKVVPANYDFPECYDDTLSLSDVDFNFSDAIKDGD